MARRPRPTLAQVDGLLQLVAEARQAQANAERARDAAIDEARDFGRRQIQLRRSLEQYVGALHDLNAGRQRLGGCGIDPIPDHFGGSTGLDPVGIGGTPTPNNPNPTLRWYQRRREA